jgi:hypothetical protein
MEVTHYGGGGREERFGLAHFAPGTKVWVLPAQWGDGWESALVVGRHRGSPHRNVQLIVGLRHLENFRVEAIYSPSVYREMRKPIEPMARPPTQWESREHAQAIIERHPHTSARLQLGK